MSAASVLINFHPFQLQAIFYVKNKFTLLICIVKVLNIFIFSYGH